MSRMEADVRLGTVLEWVLTIVLSIVAPIVVYDVATDRGVAEVPALLLAGIGPLVEMVITAVIRRRLDEFGTIVLILLALSVAVALVGGGPQALLLRESAVTGLFGLAMLVSIPTSRPIMFLFGRRFATGGVPERIAWWNGLWRYPDFRRMQRQLTAMWGVVLLAEAVVRGGLTFELPVATMVVVNAVVPPAVIAVLVTVTILWGRHARRAAEARAAAASPPAQAPA